MMSSSLFSRTSRLVISQTKTLASNTTQNLTNATGKLCTPNHAINPHSQIRQFGRKAGKMGKHLENLDEFAHQENRKQKKNSSKHNNSSTTTTTAAAAAQETSFEVEDIILAEDEQETQFDHGGSEENESATALPSKDDVQQRMMKVVHAMEHSFKAIRGAEPSPELFDSVQVKAYGSMTPLNAVAQVVISSPTMAIITCFDPETCSAVKDGVRDMTGMNFNPRVEDGAVLVPIPRVIAETRKAIVKQLGKVAEGTKQRVRRIRRAAQDVVKLGKDGKLGPGISEDDAFRVSKEIDAVTEDSINILNDILEEKRDNIMLV
jgi:ribosome recycling factor